MESLWIVFLVVSLWTILNNPALEADASFIPSVTQAGSARSGNLPYPVHEKPPPVEKYGKTRNISIVGDDIVLDGKPLNFIGGSIHYFRVAAAYWRDRLRKLKAAGLNVVTTYAAWNFHEPEEGQYTFEGDADIAKFIQTAAEEGLYVSLRVGPYIGADREMGGIPFWLLTKYPDIKLRTLDSNYQMHSKFWLSMVFYQVKHLLYGNGGPIILVQVENKYGDYGNYMPYKLQLRDTILKYVGDKALLFTTDGHRPWEFTAGAIPNTLTTIAFTSLTNDPNFILPPFRKFRPHGPLINSEYHGGGVTHWGEDNNTVSVDVFIEILEILLRMKAHINFYVFCGGTNFGFTSGASWEDGYNYSPHMTSYDYDAPLTEAGDPTPKYFAIRNTLKKFNLLNESIGPIEPSPKGKYGPVKVALKFTLFSPNGRKILGKKYADVKGARLPTFEQLGQKSGLVLYETTLSVEGYHHLEILKPRDMVIVYMDNKFQGCLSRANHVYRIPITPFRVGANISFLVENQGRLSDGIKRDFKGIMSEITINKKDINGNWTVTGYPFETIELPDGKDLIPDGPATYEGRFTLPANHTPLETYLDTTGWGKGYVWLNGHNLGRYWPLFGPQVTLYVPGVWLKAAPEENLIQIVELLHPAASFTMTFIDYPIINGTVDTYNYCH